MPTRKRHPCPDCGKPTKGERCRECATANHYNNLDYEIADRQRNAYLKWKYGWSVEEFEAYWYAQHGKCYICRIPMKRPTKGQGQSLDVVAVDHDHKTGEVRALLCNKCNKGLGHFNDNPVTLMSAIRYLTNEY